MSNPYSTEDTIAEIITGNTKSGVGIIRVSGSQSISKVSKIYVNKNKEHRLESYKANTIHYGYIIKPDENSFDIIDEVLVSVFYAPYSYTAENVIEINCHGGIYVLRKILQLITEQGIRLAEPGEFTKRAFLHGRIDLSKAEAVMDIINSENEFSLKNSVSQLSGSLSAKIQSLRERVLYEIAFIESALDDPEHISLDGYSDKIDSTIENILIELEKLLNDSKNSRILREGINTVIVGKPNAGKSSLLNRLVGEDKAIVTDIAGTTRDIIEDHILIGDVSLNIIDTAGIHDTNDVIEKIGVEKAEKYAKDADLIIYVIDSSIAMDDNDRRIMSLLTDKKVIILFNKSDLEQKVSEDDLKEISHCDYQVIKTSFIQDVGIDELRRIIYQMFFDGEIEYSGDIYVTNLRHRVALEETRDSLLLVKKSIEQQMPEDFLSIDLMNAYARLGSIIGEEVEDDLVNEIFSKFCTGK